MSGEGIAFTIDWDCRYPYHIVGSFEDVNDHTCRIGASSLATDEAIWLGLDSPDGKPMLLTREMVRVLLPHLQCFADSGSLHQ